jgi:hypothetical protein
MDEIRVRIWDKRYKKMIPPDRDTFMNTRGEVCIFNYKLQEIVVVSKELYEVSLSTGYKDIKGEEIFKGDILRKHHTLLIESYLGALGCWISDDDFIPICNIIDLILQMEVIGNIYENPELLSI